jgi:GGDEF domain-containing protein
MKQIAIIDADFKGVDDLISSKDEYKGIYITSDFNGDLDSLAYKLRSSEFWYHPIITESSNNNQLLDDSATLEDATKIFDKTQKLISKLKMNIELFKKEEKLLLYLFLRDDLELNPIFHKDSHKLYSYPIVECFSASSKDSDWLYELVNRDFLEFAKLVDRVRLCTKCNSAHLYFVDLCQQCKSVNIKETKLLHCFTCGHVDDEKLFETPNGLVCQKCHTELKLIGVDYDIPASQFKCQECAFISEEPLVEARCMECLESNTPDKLNIYEFYKLRLTLLGREYLLSDQKKALFSIFSKNIRYIKIEEFKLFLNWIISAYKRNKDFPFVVVHLEFSNIDEIMQHYGLTQMNELFSELSKRLLELLRDTDMLSIDKDYSAWILLPTTFKKGIESRLLNAINELQTHDDVEFEMKLNTFYAVETDLGENLEVNYIMDMLKQKGE